jgi:glycosyltransferase involved in cell wall biosynthesis
MLARQGNCMNVIVCRSVVLRLNRRITFRARPTDLAPHGARKRLCHMRLPCVVEFAHANSSFTARKNSADAIIFSFIRIAARCCFWSKNAKVFQNMKIAIDGFNMGFVTGTGIATYARELSHVLAGAGHEVMPVFGLNRVGSHADVSWSRFIQAMTVRGEARRFDFSEWGLRFALNTPGFLARYSFMANEIPVNEVVNISSVKERLPAFSRIFNLPSLYRSAQARAWFSRTPTYIKLPSHSTPDVFHLTLPLPISMKGVKKVVTVHDVIPLVLPNSTEVNLWHYYKMLQASLQDADLVFAVSEHSKHDLMKFVNIPEEKIHVTWQTVNIPKSYTELPDADVAKYVEGKFSLGHKQYFLFYSAVEPKKNVMRLLEAFGLADTRYPIVVVGKNGWLYKDVEGFFEENPWPERFKRINYVSFRDLMYLLKGARALVFPSLYEGFGLPVLEAMEMGCPVITSRNSSLPEVGGDAALYVDPLDVRAMADAIDTLATDDQRVATMVEKGYVQAEKFSVANYQARLTEAYAQLR